MNADATIRLAVAGDLPTIADVYLAARATAQMPPLARPVAEVRDWVTAWDLGEDDVWVAETDARVSGFAKLTSTWLDALYVAPDAQRSGIGTTLLEVCKSTRAGGFGLWVFESNRVARAFYARHGLIELEHTDGHANEEGAPDIKMIWPGADPLACFRSLIDDTDLVLADVLARRVALTRAVQQHKRAAGLDRGRDAAREAQIVARMATLVPDLGEDRLARIMHLVISESLDAS